jgi:uncharacterized protein (DUF1330 family)
VECQGARVSGGLVSGPKPSEPNQELPVAAYVIGEVEVTDASAYEPYKPLAAASIAAHGGTYLVRGGTTESLEGQPATGRVVVLEFADLEAARAWYRSAQYQEALPIRQAASKGRLFLVEGAEGARP